MKKLLIAFLIYSGVVNAQLTQRSTPPLSVTLNNTFYQDTVGSDLWDTITSVGGATWFKNVISYPRIGIVDTGFNNGDTFVIGGVMPSGWIPAPAYGFATRYADTTYGAFQYLASGGDRAVLVGKFSNTDGIVGVLVNGYETSLIHEATVKLVSIEDDAITIKHDTAVNIQAGLGYLDIKVANGSVTAARFNQSVMYFGYDYLTPQSSGYRYARLDSAGNVYTFNLDSVINHTDSLVEIATQDSFINLFYNDTTALDTMVTGVDSIEWDATGAIIGFVGNQFNDSLYYYADNTVKLNGLNCLYAIDIRLIATATDGTHNADFIQVVLNFNDDISDVYFLQRYGNYFTGTIHYTANTAYDAEKVSLIFTLTESYVASQKIVRITKLK